MSEKSSFVGDDLARLKGNGRRLLNNGWHKIFHDQIGGNESS